MSSSKYASTDLLTVINTLISYMDRENAQRMAKDLSPGKSYIPSCNKAYNLYEKALSGTLQKPVTW